MSTRVAVNLSSGFVPGINSVINGVVSAGNELGWNIVGIHDGFEGLLFPERYPRGGMIDLSPDSVEGILSAPNSVLGTATKVDPFRVRTINAENQVEEVDRSDELSELLAKNKIDSVISVVGTRGLSVLFKLHRKGLRVIAIPKSVENEVAVTELSFGFSSVLSCAVEMLERLREAARSAQRVGVIEVLGEHSGWLALQAGIAVCADAILIPEIGYDIQRVAARIRAKWDGGARHGLVVVAEGAQSRVPEIQSTTANPLKASLAPLATGQASNHVIERSGFMAKKVAGELQRLTGHETYPLALGQLIKAGHPTAVDRQLGLAYGAAAIRALHENYSGVMTAFVPPELKFVPLSEAINKIRTVPARSLFLQTARSLGICLGD
jgi:ATP-dependent phosphofructokinase / diphosphate-dependent phosphofructokinase